MEPSKEELTQKLSTAARSVEHLNSLLHETEATNAVLMEQITVRHTHTHTPRMCLNTATEHCFCSF